MAVGDGLIKGSYGSLLGSPSLGYELWELDTWEPGTKGQAAVLTEAETGECIGYDTVATNCGNAGFPKELFGTAWRPAVPE